MTEIYTFQNSEKPVIVHHGIWLPFYSMSRKNLKTVGIGPNDFQGNVISIIANPVSKIIESEF